MTTWANKVSEARAELSKKSLRMIQRETAITWAARAVASFMSYKRTKNLQWLLDAEEYAHEAVEHAALYDCPEFQAEISGVLAQAKVGIRL